MPRTSCPRYGVRRRARGASGPRGEIGTILEGNRRLRARVAHEELVMMPRLRMLVVGCADPRVDPQQVLGLQLGNAAVVRNIGGRVTAPTIATISGLGRVGARAAASSGRPGASGGPGLDLVVLHHTDCGIVRLADEPAALAGFIGADLAGLPDLHIEDPYAAVARDAAVLRSLGLPGARVWGLVYDVATGVVEVAAAPAQDAA